MHVRELPLKRLLARKSVARTIILGGLLCLSGSAWAVPANSASLTDNALSLVVGLTILSLAPGILMTVTSFVRIIVSLSLLRSGFGAPGAPPNMVLISLALFLSFFIMKPVFDEAWDKAASPYLSGQMQEVEAFEKGSAPFKQFMLTHTREADLRLFLDVANESPSSPQEVELRTLIPAFMISELRTAFEIGFLLLLPFLIIDLVVASVLMALGLMMLPPATVSLPAKLIFFVMVDGWALVAGSLIRSYAGAG